MGVCCVAVFIDTNKIIRTKFIYKQIQGSKRNSVCNPENNRISSAPVKLLGCSSVQVEDSYMLVSTYELSVLIPSRVGGEGGTCVRYT